VCKQAVRGRRADAEALSGRTGNAPIYAWALIIGAIFVGLIVFSFF
jgi:hypothetical protein